MGSQALDRESALSLDSIKELSGYLYWRAILEGQDEGTTSDGIRMLDDIRRSAALPKSVLEFSKLLWEMSEESVAKFIRNSKYSGRFDLT